MRASDLAALRGFDALPDSAHVRLPVVMALFSISRATVWRWCASGDLPLPIHVGGVTFWKVAELRERLRGNEAGAQDRAAEGPPGAPTPAPPGAG
jgi:predicted DNA-binding transcriptional regulator AlpA